MTETYDVIIAGAGASGILLANRLAIKSPESKILVVEKEPHIGGRIRDTKKDDSQWSYGLNRISSELYQFLEQTIRSNPQAEDIEEFSHGEATQIGVLAASKVQSLDLEEMFTKKGARLVGGAAAARDWTVYDSLVSMAQEEKGAANIGSIWSAKRNAPSSIVLQHLARAVGIPNVWQASTDALLERRDRYIKPGMNGRWEDLLNELVVKEEGSEESSNIDVITDSMLVDAAYDEEAKEWAITTSYGEIKGRRLAVCQNPWDAIKWLPKALWPVELLAIVNKTKPVSLLTITETLSGISDIPGTIIVPAEDSQIIVRADYSEVTFQATLDFELSLQAPAVVKAVKRLKRARRKFQAAYPEAKMDGDHLALQTVGWSQPISASDKRYMKKLDSYKFNQPHLVFCGDAYGASYCGEKNTIRSVLASCENFVTSVEESPAQ